MITRYRVDKTALLNYVEQTLDAPQVRRNTDTSFCLLVLDTASQFNYRERTAILESGDIFFSHFAPSHPITSPWDKAIEVLNEANGIMLYNYPLCLLCDAESNSFVYSLDDTAHNFALCVTCREHVMSGNFTYVEEKIKKYVQQIVTTVAIPERLRQTSKIFKIDPEAMRHKVVMEKTALYTHAIKGILSEPWGEEALPKEDSTIAFKIFESAARQWQKGQDHD